MPHFDLLQTSWSSDGQKLFALVKRYIIDGERSYHIATYDKEGKKLAETHALNLSEPYRPDFYISADNKYAVLNYFQSTKGIIDIIEIESGSTTQSYADILIY